MRVLCPGDHGEVGKPLFRTLGRRRELMPAGLTLISYGREIVSLFTHVLAALDLSGIPYVERLTSPVLAGVRPSVVADLGVTVRTASSFFARTRELGRPTVCRRCST